jgi:hypothetical protein
MKSMSTRQRRLKTSKEFIGSKGRPRPRLRLREAKNQPGAVAELQYDVIGLPMDVTRSEKLNRLSELGDTITNIEGSDV